MTMWGIDSIRNLSCQSKSLLEDFHSGTYAQEANLRIAIVGGGPRGAYAIERLASVWNSKGKGKTLEIVCFNKTPDFGTGPNFSTSQPAYLLMNNPIGQVNFWTEEKEQLIHDRPNLVEFIKRYKVDKEKHVQPDQFCSRALTGLYIKHCFVKVIEALPANIRVHLIIDEVVSLLDEEGKVKLQTQSGMLGSFDEVICCSGHSYTLDTKERHIYDGKMQNSTKGLVNQIYPIENISNQKVKGEKVVVKGLGLTSIDVILGLTEGRGGKFYRENGKLKYLPSRNEPHSIYAYSRSGIPMMARQPPLADKVFTLRFFSQESVDYLCRSFNKLDFRKQVLPFIVHEFRYQYVMHLLHFYTNQHIPQDKTLCDLEHCAGLLFPGFKPFDLNEFLSPKFSSIRAPHQAVKYLRLSANPDKAKPLQASRIAMSALWAKIYPLCQQLYAFGKLTGTSQRYFDRHFYKKIQRTAFGPPKENVEKLLALADTSILSFGKGELAKTNKVAVHNASGKPEHNKIAKTCIDARIAKSAGFATQPEYIQRLLNLQNVNFFDNDGYTPGCLALDQIGRVVSQERICMYGVPTEGWTLDNESLSRTNNNLLSNWIQTSLIKYTKNEIFAFNTHFTPLDRRA